VATPTFFHAELSQSDRVVTLNAVESAHAHKSRRLRIGDSIHLINGKGLFGYAKIDSSSPKKVVVKLDRFQQHPKPTSVSIASALPKGDRQRTMIDMLTQLTVSEFIPLQCEYSVTRYKASMKEKWSRVAIEACKQSQNPWLPNFQDAQRLPSMVQRPDQCVFYADASGELAAQLFPQLTSQNANQISDQNGKRKSKLNEKVTVMIGPEGGFSESELVLFEKSNIKPLKLSANILRTELAAISAATQITAFLAI